MRRECSWAWTGDGHDTGAGHEATDGHGHLADARFGMWVWMDVCGYASGMFYTKSCTSEIIQKHKWNISGLYKSKVS